jgi:hypothetical protein
MMREAGAETREGNEVARQARRLFTLIEKVVTGGRMPARHHGGG